MVGNSCTIIALIASGTQLTGITDHQLTILGIVLAILSIAITTYLGYPYVKKANRQNKIELDQVKIEIKQVKQDIIEDHDQEK